MNLKKYHFLRYVSILVFLGTCAYVFWPPKDVTEEEARKLATEELSRFSKGLRVDISGFKGPYPTEPPMGMPYGFEWIYKDQQGEAKIYVWVERHGTTWSTSEGDYERLRTIPR